MGVSNEFILGMKRIEDGKDLKDNQFHNTPYNDKGKTKTIGIGHVWKSGEPEYLNNKQVLEQFSKDLIKAEDHLRILMGGEKNYDKLPSSVKEALLDMTFNKGTDIIKNTEGLLWCLKNGKYEAAICKMTNNVSSATNKPMSGLSKRRLFDMSTASKMYKENIPMIINLEEWKNRTANLRIQGSDPFDYFKHKVAPRPNLPVLLNLTPFAHFIVHGNRILVTGPGNRKEIFLLALLTPFCSYTLMPASSKGTVLFVRHDQSYFHDWAATLQGNHGLNVSDLNQWQLSNNISGPYPLLLDMPLNISTLDPKSTSDCQHLLTLIEQAVWRQNTEGPKVLVLDSLSQFLV